MFRRSNHTGLLSAAAILSWSTHIDGFTDKNISVKTLYMGDLLTVGERETGSNFACIQCWQGGQEQVFVGES